LFFNFREKISSVHLSFLKNLSPKIDSLCSNLIFSKFSGKEKQTDGQEDRQTHSQADRRKEGRAGGRMGGRDGGMDE
jgi:hypothetical protein